MPEATYAAVMERDGHTCQARAWGFAHHCRGVLEIHHRRNRGMGGGGPDQHDPEYLLVVCSFANHWVAEHPAEAEALGLYVRH